MILAQRLERAAAVGADSYLRMMDVNVARQVRRECARFRLGGWRCHRFQAHCSFRLARFQVFQLQFDLVEEVIRPLRALPVLLAAQLGDPELEVRDFRLAGRPWPPAGRQSVP